MMQSNLILVVATYLVVLPASPVIAASQSAPNAPYDSSLLVKFYPKESRVKGEQGTVKYRARLDRKGVVQSCEIVESSGFARLDDQTCMVVTQHAVFQPFTSSQGLPAEGTILGAIDWRMSGKSIASDRAVHSNDVKICKQTEKLGSLVPKRLCATQAEWDNRRALAQAELEEARMKGFSGPCAASFSTGIQEARARVEGCAQ